MDVLISRQAALDAFGLSEKTRKYGGDHSGYDTMMLYEIQDVIEDLPSVHSEPFINKPCVSEQECHENKMKVLEEIKSELWMEGMNMTGEYQGVWVRFRDIERIINKYMNESEDT